MNTSKKQMNYPSKYYRGQGSNLVPSSFTPNRFTNRNSIIPNGTKHNHNIVGEVRTKVHLRNSRGEVMDIYQAQKVLNLVNGTKGIFEINNKGHNFNRK